MSEHVKNEPSTGTLEVPGATLHYEKRGSGPVLLLIPGGSADAGVFTVMAEELAARYTVVSYDPRGMSRSVLDGPLTDQRVAVWAEDAYRLLERVSPAGEAYVFGTSSGAITALDLLARHPERLRRVVAHEPPLVEVLEDPAPYREIFPRVREIFRAEGAAAAMTYFGEALGAEPDERATELPPEIQEMAPRMHANFPVFLEHVLCPFTATMPDVPALRRVAGKAVLAAGRDSRGQVPLYGPAARLAELLGGKVVEFPGGHVGAASHAKEFAALLPGILD
jgi:pimeloyl-ACP methyl ester carboxylesterase